ncbi:MucBP domain-containing protein [Lacticaseibacillus jixianensis]|uniref:MucBP domain-containing protein n=1 Tax=Lacticaseibacillus jixianensis TaxID=2486012 RepID=A0ABW4B829_9LACO|nr:MucBP domain-containing protein [Lacticaseibacillus jixianensis]
MSIQGQSAQAATTGAAASEPAIVATESAPAASDAAEQPAKAEDATAVGTSADKADQSDEGSQADATTAAASAASDSVKTADTTPAQSAVKANVDEAKTAEVAQSTAPAATGAEPAKEAATPSTAKPAEAETARLETTAQTQQFKTAVDPVSATWLNSLTWTPVNPSAGDSYPTLSKSITDSDTTYTFTAFSGPIPGVIDTQESAPLIYNTVADDTNSNYAYGYAFRNPTSFTTTSSYYLRDSTGKYVRVQQPVQTKATYYAGQGSDGKEYIRKDISDEDVDGNGSVGITEILSIDASGAFNHTVFVTNNGKTPIENVKFGTLLDTAITTINKSDNTVSGTPDDGVSVYANGDGSAYLTNIRPDNPAGLTLYLTPTDNDTLIAGRWPGYITTDMLMQTPASGHVNGDALHSPAMDEAAAAELAGGWTGPDSAIEYETPKLSLAPGATTSYSYSEHLYIQQVTQGTITIKYKAEDGTQLKADTTVGGAAGSPFTLTTEDKTIAGYDYDRTEGNVTSFTKGSQTVTLFFKKQGSTETTQTVTQQFQYVDDGKDGENVGDPVSETGKTGEAKTYTATAPAGYILADGQQETIDYTFKPDSPVIDIHLAHDIVPVTPEDPHDADPKAFSATATRVITYVNTSDSTKVPSPATKTQTATLTRTGTEDLATKEVTFSNWSTGTVEAVNSPEVAGYTPDKETVPTASFSTPDVDGQPSATVKVTYSATDETQLFQYVDDDKDGENVDDPVSETGKTGETKTYTATAPAGYVLADGQKSAIGYTIAPNAPVIKIHLAHDIVPVTPMDPHDADPKAFSATATREIDYVNSDDPTKVPSQTTKTQTANLTRTGTEDLATKEITFSDWSTGTVEAVDSPAVPGYTPDQQTVPTASFSTPDANGKPSATVTVTYSATDETQLFQYVDDDKGGEKVGGPVSQTGKTGEAKTYTAAAPAGYVLADGQKNAIGYTIAPNAPVIKIHLAHDIVPVTPKDPHDADPKAFSATATREIKYVNSDDPTKVPSPATQTQTATLTRTGTEDLVSKKVVFSDWSTGTVEAVNSPAVAGYTPDQQTVSAASFSTPDANGKPSATVTVTYTAADETQLFQYVDDDKDGEKVGGPVSQTGKTGEAKTYTATAPAGYVLAKSQADKIPYTLAPNAPVIDIHLAHDTVPVTPQDPHDADSTKLTATGTRTINYVKADGGETVSKSVTQTVTFSRTGTEDAITHEVTYNNDWKSTPTDAQVPYVISPFVKDFAPDQATIPASTLTNGENQTVTVKYYEVKLSDGIQTWTAEKVDQPDNLSAIPYTLVPEGPDGEPIGNPIHLVGNPGEPVSGENIPNFPNTGYDLVPNQPLQVPRTPNTPVPVKYSKTVTKVDVPLYAISYTLQPEGPNGEPIGNPIQLVGNPGEPVSKDNIPDFPGTGYDVVPNQPLKVPSTPNTTVPVEYSKTITKVDVPPFAISYTLQPEGPNGEPIGNPIHLVGNPGEPISKENIPEFPGSGYDLVPNQPLKVPSTPNTTVPVEYSHTITKVDVPPFAIAYTLQPEGPNGEPIGNPIQLVGNPGEPVSKENIPEFPGSGYDLVPNQPLKVPSTPNTTVPVEYSHTITKVDVPPFAIAYTLQPEGPNGEPIGNPIQLVGNPGEPISKENIPETPGSGYDLVPNQPLKVPSTPNTTVPVKYSHTITKVDVPPFAISYTLQPEGPNGEPIGNPIQLVGNPGEPISKDNIPDFPGSGYDLVPNQPLYVPGTPNTTVPVKYSHTITKVAVPPYTIPYTVQPEGPNGEPIGNPIHLVGNPGTPISAGDLPDIPGYTVVPNQNLTVPNEPGASLIVAYTTTPEGATTPEGSLGGDTTTPKGSLGGSVTVTPESTVGGTPAQGAAGSNANGSALTGLNQPAGRTAGKTLPQTGDAQHAGIAALGIALLGLIGLGALAKRKA